MSIEITPEIGWSDFQDMICAAKIGVKGFLPAHRSMLTQFHDADRLMVRRRGS
jgi:hypothetical protein